MTEGGSWVLTILGGQKQEPGHRRRNSQDSALKQSRHPWQLGSGGHSWWECQLGGTHGGPLAVPIKVLNVRTLGPTCTKNIPEVLGGLLQGTSLQGQRVLDTQHRLPCLQPGWLSLLEAQRRRGGLPGALGGLPTGQRDAVRPP